MKILAQKIYVLVHYGSMLHKRNVRADIYIYLFIYLFPDEDRRGMPRSSFIKTALTYFLELMFLRVLIPRSVYRGLRNY